MFWQSQLWISYRAFVLKLSMGSESSLQENKFIYNHRHLNSNASSGDGLLATKTGRTWVCICTCVHTGRTWVCICTCVHTGRTWACICTCVYTGRTWVCICTSVHTQVLPFVGTSLILKRARGMVLACPRTYHILILWRIKEVLPSPPLHNSNILYEFYPHDSL